MKISKKSETATTITFQWTPPAGVDGYRFYSAGVFRSDTWDATRKTVKFSKGQEPYQVEAIRSTAYEVIDAGSYPAAVPPPPPPPPPPAPSPALLAPQSYNQGSRGQNARYNVRINCVPEGSGFRDGGGFYYDESGLQQGGRSEKHVEGLKPADEMDGREPWDPYEHFGNTLPPYPPESYTV